MYTLIGGLRRSGGTLFFSENEAQWFRKKGCGAMILKGGAMKYGVAQAKVNPVGFSATSEALVSLDGKRAVIL